MALPGPHMCGPPVGACAYRNISAKELLFSRLGRMLSARFFAEARQFVFVEAAFVFLQQRPSALQIGRPDVHVVRAGAASSGQLRAAAHAMDAGVARVLAA